MELERLRLQMLGNYNSAINAFSDEEYQKAYDFMMETSKAASLLAKHSSNLEDSEEYQDLSEHYLKKAKGYLSYIDSSSYQDVVEIDEPTHGFDDFVGYDGIKEYFRKTILTPWKESKFYQREKNALLIYGPHGVSKTRFVHALIKELQANAYYFQPIKHFRMSEFSNIEYAYNQIFAKAFEQDNVVFFIESPLPFFPSGDDIDSQDIADLFMRMFRKELKRAKKKKKNLLLVATTSVPDKLNTACFGDGLFDDFIRLHRLSKEERGKIIKRYFKKQPLSVEEEVELIEKTKGFVTTDISRLCKLLLNKPQEERNVIISTFVEEDISGYQKSVSSFENIIKDYKIIDN